VRERGRVSLCATPIGNLGDITLRVRDALEKADVVYAEDTRVTGKLLAALGVKKPLFRMDENMLSNNPKAVQGLIDRASAGEWLVYCTDAGMPGVSDPGLRLVSIIREQGYLVEVLPGVSALTCAYVLAAPHSSHLYFGGFLPKKSEERLRVLKELSGLKATLVFYESPHRLKASLASLAEIFPYRQVTLCRELTKLHEQVMQGRAAELYKLCVEVPSDENYTDERFLLKGEMVIVVDVADEEEKLLLIESQKDNAKRRAMELMVQGLRKKEVSRVLVKEFSLHRNEAYAIVHSL